MITCSTRVNPIIATLLMAMGLTATAIAAEVKLDGHKFQLPAGFMVEKVTAPPLIERPICADLIHKADFTSPIHRDPTNRWNNSSRIRRIGS